MGENVAKSLDLSPSKATKSKTLTNQHKPLCSLPESARAGKGVLFLGRLDQGQLATPRARMSTVPKRKATLVPNVGSILQSKRSLLLNNLRRVCHVRRENSLKTGIEHVVDCVSAL